MVEIPFGIKPAGITSSYWSKNLKWPVKKIWVISRNITPKKIPVAQYVTKLLLYYYRHQSHCMYVSKSCGELIQYTANIFDVIFTVFNCVPISTVISLYGLHLIAAPSTVE